MKIAFAAFLGLAVVGGAQAPDPRTKLIGDLNSLAHSKLEARQQTVAAIQTKAEAEKRRTANREKLLRLIGGLPERHGVPAVKEFGTLPGDGFRVEKIAFESQPGFWVTANLYVPTAGNGPFPGVVITPGHEPSGKAVSYNSAFGVNLARNGIETLVYDVMGQGERLQYYDAEKKASQLGGPTAEHSQANVQALPAGDEIARYMVNDAMRALDYLTARKEVDGSRIGALGCSGGGTVTAYFAALDDRVKAAGAACYINTFDVLLPSRTGVQEAEQSIPRFIESGLDFGDWVEAMAPKPYAIISTSEDMFPFEGARKAFEEAKHIWSVDWAADKVEWITGPGGHANLFPIAQNILSFFTRNLKGGEPALAFTQTRPAPADLICTPTGQVSTALDSKPIYQLIRERGATVQTPHLSAANLKREVRALAGISAQPGAAPLAVESKSSEQKNGYRIEKLEMDGLPMLLGVPDAAGAKAAVLVLAADPAVQVEQAAMSGKVALAVEPRPWPGGVESAKTPLLGLYNLLALRAFLVGKTMVGMRADDAIHALDWLAARKDVDANKITAYGNGPQAVALLHAAVLDARIHAVTLDNGLTSYRSIMDTPLHRNASEVLVPGALRQYDLTDLAAAIAPRKVTILNARDASGALASR